MSGIDSIIEQVGDSPLALAKVARNLLAPKGDWARARALCDRALSMAPDDGEIRAIHAEVHSAGVGPWYFNMVLDDARHRAYGRAIERAVASGGRVLDIGTGTGLFAMMAARAGADEVVSCERNEVVAATARAAIALNGFQDRVRVIAKPSTGLAVGLDMADRADVLIWDNTGSDLVGLGTLPEVEDAMRRLVKPGARVIPAGGAICAALAEHPNRHRRRMGIVDGLDLTPFNALAAPVYPVERGRVSTRSSAATLFAFDLRAGGPFPPQTVAKPVVGEGGTVNGVVQWLKFAVDDHDSYSSGPDVAFSAFTLNFRPLANPVEASIGRKFSIGASHDRTNLRIWLEDA